MNKVQQIAAYYLKHSKSKSISELRLTKILYLCDWIHCLVHDSYMTNFKWMLKYCVTAEGVNQSIMSGQHFSMQVIKQHSEIKEYTLLFPNINNTELLVDSEIKVIDYILKHTDELYFNDLINYIHSTYPLREDTIYRDLDLLKSAKNYHQKNSLKTNINEERKEDVPFYF